MKSIELLKQEVEDQLWIQARKLSAVDLCTVDRLRITLTLIRAEPLIENIIKRSPDKIELLNRYRHLAQINNIPKSERWEVLKSFNPTPAYDT